MTHTTPTAPDAPLSVGQAIAAIIRELPGIGKGGTAPANMGGFKYRGIEQMTAAIQPLLGEHGVVIVPQAREIEVVKSLGSKNPAMQDVQIRFDWLIVGPDGSTLTGSTYGIGRDHTDKGGNKAQTQAYKYLLMHLFCISDPKDDGDGHDYTRGEHHDDVSGAADAASPMASRGDEIATRLGDLLRRHPEHRASVRALSEDNDGKRFAGDDLESDPGWADIVERFVDATEARIRQDLAAKRAASGGATPNTDHPGGSDA